MRISHRRRFVFLSNPRCGSTTVRRLLDLYTDIASTSEYPYHHHTSAPPLKRHFDRMGWDWDDYFVFTTIRNPWDRMVSIWSYGRKNPFSVWHSYSGLPFPDFIDGMEQMFESVLAENHPGQESIALSDFEGGLVDRVIRLEDFNPLLPEVLECLHVYYRGPIGQVNASDRRASYRRMYTSDRVKRVAEYFASDIEVGRYVF